MRLNGRVLVTGANGFLGRHLVAKLLAQGRPVAALDLEFDADFPEEAERITASVTDPAPVWQAAQGVQAIIHAAAIAHLWTRRAGAHDTVNVGGTRNVAAAARGAGARLVHVSSYTTLVAASTRPGETLDERAEHPPEALLGPYPASKRQAELAVLASVAAEGLDAVIVLPTAPVGPGDRRLTPPSRMILDLAAGRTPALIDTMLDLVDVRALADGVIAALGRGRTGQRYLLTGETVTLADLAERVAQLTGGKAPSARVPMKLAIAAARAEEAVARLTGRPPRAPLTGALLAAHPIRLDAARARAELGLTPPPLAPALSDAIGWMRQEGLLR